ncbi:HPP family protein [Micromonospora chersina]|uniref:HPP family protein n=1 Tax=Micromonospora chersina TaxID=47854 RepID=UPI0033FC3B47
MSSATLRSGTSRREAGVVALSAGSMLLGAAALLAVTEQLTGLDVFALPFVASAAVLAMAPRAPLARPTAVLISYASCAPIAVAITAAAGPSVWTATAAAVSSVVAMLLLGAPHPPAAVCAAFIGLTGASPGYPLHTVLPAVAIVLGAALVSARLLPHYDYRPSWHRRGHRSAARARSTAARS